MAGTLILSCVLKHVHTISQRALYSFSVEPYGGDADLRTMYCAFAISKMLDDWSGICLDQALRFIASCRVSYFRMNIGT